MFIFVYLFYHLYICVMVSNVIMSSSDRELFGITIRQETKTGFLNLTDLQNSYNNQCVVNNWNEKRIDHIFNYKDNHERIYYVLKEQGIIIPPLAGFIEEVENNGIIHTLKKYKVFKTTGARHTKATWCNPYIFTMIALELHPIFYAKVIMWLTDELIINRIGAGNFYRELSGAITKFNPNGNDFMSIAKGLNYIVFNRHENGIRNTATKSELKELEDIEKKLAFAINMGYINSIDQLLNEMRKMYFQKNGHNNILSNN